MKESTIRVSEAFQVVMQGLEDCLTAIAGEKQGFFLMVFTEGRASYGSNCNREEIVQQMKELLADWEKGMPDIPAHKVQ